MSEKPPDKKDELLGLFKKLWLPVAGFLGAVTLAYNFYRLWVGDQEVVTYFLAGGGLVVLAIALVWVGFGWRTETRDAIWPLGKKVTEKKSRFALRYRRMAWMGLGIICLGSAIGIFLLVQHQQTQEQKLIVVITMFDEPEKDFGLRNEIIEILNADYAGDEEIEIVPIQEIVLVGQGSTYARKLGKDYLADMVIWGWYRSTDNPNVTIHIENLLDEKFLPIVQSSTLKPIVALAELESFSFQQTAGEETSALISFIAGFIDYQAGNYQIALERFDKALNSLSENPRLFENRAALYFYRGNINRFENRFQNALRDYDRAIEIDPQFAGAYINRGNIYSELGNYSRSIQDYDKAIELYPQIAEAYNNRGLVYFLIEDYPRSIKDYDQAIEINPQFAEAYNNRGNSYSYLENHLRSIRHYID